MTQSKAWVTCANLPYPHWEDDYCEAPKPVGSVKKIDSILGCVIDEMPAPRPSRGEHYHGK